MSKNIEELEARISMLREDSRMASFRIKYHSERRSKIQAEIRNLKDFINELKELDEDEDNE